MKYLSSRTEYLKSAKYKVTNESYAGAGPFANDIKWGDSLVGRLLNSIIRKTKIGINLVRIKSVISRLNEQFEYILNDAELAGTQMSDELKASLDRLIMSLYIGELHTYLQETDEKGNTLLEEVSNTTKKAIDDVESYELKDEKSDPDRKELVLLLNEFLTEIDNMKVEETDEEGTDEEGTDEEGTDEETDEETDDKKSEKIPYQLYMANIKSISNILESYKKIKSIRPEVEPKKVEEPDSYFEWGAKGEELYKKRISEWEESQKALGPGANLKPDDNTRNKIKREIAYEIWSSKGNSGTEKDFMNSKEGQIFSNSIKNAKSWKTATMESRIFSLNEGTDSMPIMNATKSLFNFMNEDRNNLIELQALISSYDKQSDENKNKLSSGNKEMMQNYGSVKRLYDYIKKTSVSENLDSLLSNSEKLGNHIKNLYSVSKSGDLTEIDKDGRDKDGALKNSIKSFNKTMGAILAHKPEVIENEDKPKDNVDGEGSGEVTKGKSTGTIFKKKVNDSKLLRYEGFRKIFEADEIEEPTTEEPKPKFANQKATREEESYDTSIPWNKVFNADYMKKWKITDEEKNRLLSEAGNITNDPNGLYLIEGIDPIMEIVRIFNRAYKLHTTQTIPGARSNGKVTNLKMSEYTYVGSNSGGAPTKNQDSSGFSVGIGPFRNNAIFNEWEDAVTKILGNSKYQVLFNDKTIIQVGTADKRDGKSLLKFMRNMLDGDGLYKNNGGAQSKFIEEYFGTKVETEKLAFGGINEVEEISENADMTKEPIVCEFKTTNEISFNQRSIHTIDNGKDVYYLMFLNTDDKFAYFKYSKSFYHFNKYLKGDAKVEKGSLDSVELKESPISYGRISERALPITVNDKLKFKSIKIGGENGFNTDGERVVPEEINLGNIKSTNSLSSEDGLFKLESTKKTSSGKSDGNRYNDYAQALKKDVKPKEDESNPGQ